MASFAPLHTGQFIIRPRSLRRRRWLLVGMTVALLIIPYVTFELGRMRAGYSVISSQRARFEQASRINELQNELIGLRKQLGSAQLGRKVDQQSSDSMQQSFASLQATIQKQQEELAFYKAIVTPAGDAPKTPQVQQLEVQPDVGTRRYVLRMTLTQPMQAIGNAQGTVQVQVSGTRAGQPATMSLQELSVEKPLALNYAYRYFQTLEQLIELPEDFQPVTVQVELRSGQHVVQQQEFPWQSHPVSTASTQ